jgi:hypothetical protein
MQRAIEFSAEKGRKVNFSRSQCEKFIFRPFSAEKVNSVCVSVFYVIDTGGRQERGESSGVSKVFLRIPRKSILFEQKT